MRETIGVGSFARTLIGAVPSLLLAAAAFADGTQTGILAGTVADASGELLQGVEVRLEGPRIQRTAITDAGGRFRFPALGVGSYSVAAELLGLAAGASEVAVYVHRTSEVDLTLGEAGGAAEPSVVDWIQVVAEAPVIDRFETRVGANVRLELLDELPVERFYQSVALLLPGVAGGEDGNPETSGALRGANLFLIDGVDTTDPTTGLFGLNLSYEAIREVQVTTAAKPSEYGRSSGAVINVVTRSGGNRYRGVVRWLATNNDRNSAYDVAGDDRAHLGRELEAANAGPDELNSTLALSLGGPLWRDRLWFFAAHEDTGRSFLRPTIIGQLWDEDTDVESGAFKLTWQPTSQHTLVAQHTSDEADFTAFEPFASSPSELALPESPAVVVEEMIVNPVPGEVFALEDVIQEGRLTRLQWNAALGQNYALALTLAKQERVIERGPMSSRGLTADAPHAAVLIDPRRPEEIYEVFLFNGVTEEGSEKRPREQGNLAFEAFLRTGALEHELEVGVDYQKTRSEIELDAVGLAAFDRATGFPVSGQVFIDLDLRPECLILGQCIPFDPRSGELQPFGLFNFWRRPRRATREENLAFYVSDTLIMDRWLLNLGLRWESIEGQDEAGGWLVDDSDLAPRIGLSWDPTGEGEVVLSATWGRFYEPFLQQYLDAYGRIDPLTGFTEYERREEVDGLDCSEVDPGNLFSRCWQPIDFVPFFPLSIGEPDQGLERASVDELVVGFERQVTANTGVSLHYIDRRWRDLWDDVLSVVDDEGSGGEDFVAEVLNLPQAEREYRAVQLLVQKRYADNWQLLASYTWSEAEGNLFSAEGLDTFADFRDSVDTNLVNRFGPAPYDRPHQLGIFGNYQIPFERFLVSLGSILRYRDGVPYEMQQFEEAGIRFLTPRGSERLSGNFQWDLAAGLDVRLASELEVELKLEAFNVTDEQQQLAAESLVDTGLFGLPRTVNDLQRPRTYRFLLGLRF